MTPLWINNRRWTVWFKDQTYFDPDTYMHPMFGKTRVKREWFGLQGKRTWLRHLWMRLRGWSLYRVAQTKLEYRSRFRQRIKKH